MNTMPARRCSNADTSPGDKNRLGKQRSRVLSHIAPGEDNRVTVARDVSIKV